MVSCCTWGSCGNTRGGRGRKGQESDSWEREVISCYYCKEPEHVKKYCPKLSAKNAQSSQFAYVMTSNSTQEYVNNLSVTIFDNKYAKYMHSKPLDSHHPLNPLL